MENNEIYEDAINTELSNEELEEMYGEIPVEPDEIQEAPVYKEGESNE